MKNEKGITLVVLVVTVVLLVILSGVTIYEIKVSSSEKQIRKMEQDIEILHDRVVLYYNKHRETPKTNRSIGLFEPEVTYWEIDLNKLDINTLNFGYDYGNEGELRLNESDVYVINSNFEIVYLKGINYEGQNYYQNDDDKNQIDDLN